MNNITIMGRLAAVPELRHTQSGVAVCAFTVAVPRSYAKQGEERQTDWLDCVAWKGTAEFICRNFTKGRMIGIIGEVQTRSYTDKEGNKRKAVEVNVGKAFFCGEKKETAEAAPAETGYDEQDWQPIANDEDLPF